MRRLFLLLICAALATANTLPAQDSPSDHDTLQGTWKVTAAEVNGKPLPAKSFKDAELVVRGNDYRFYLDGVKLNLTFRVDPGTKPKAIDLTLVEGPHKGKVYRGIYALEKDTFKICRATEPAKDRPAKFATKAASGVMLVEWRRVKP